MCKEVQCVNGSSKINSGAPPAVHHTAEEVKKSTEPLGVSSMHHCGKSMLKESKKQCEQVHMLSQITAEYSTQSTVEARIERESKHNSCSPSSVSTSITINSEVRFY